MKAKLNFKQSVKAGALAALTATIINSIIFLIFHSSGVITDNIFIQPGKPLSVIPVIISSIAPTIIAAMIFFLMEKYLKHGFKVFRSAAIVLLVLSFVNPFIAIEGINISYGLVLCLMHIVVVAALLYSISKEMQPKA